MRYIVFAAALIIAASSAHAQSRSGNSSGGLYGSSPSYPTYGTGSNPRSNSVDGYTTDRGTYVAPHQRTNPNGTQYDNYNSRGNTNPYSGNTGTRSPRY
ncbi:MAG: hypothetical protein FD144_4221 [Rhodospirillaceae bacterium]|nr:MAG: hypothetical protein FD144_4221 [Rhodospirillaceae bacterium]